MTSTDLIARQCVYRDGRTYVVWTCIVDWAYFSDAVPETGVFDANDQGRIANRKPRYSRHYASLEDARAGHAETVAQLERGALALS